MEKTELIKLIKRYGGSLELLQFMAPPTNVNYPTNFTQFMDQMLDEYKISRKQMAVRAGLSVDYCYKLLRGDKKTTERDYILAMCIATGMNLAQTQHALRIYGMPLLAQSDLRGLLISYAIDQHYSIEQLNDLLEKSEYPLLRTSPDMPSAPIEFSADISPVLTTETSKYAAVHNYTIVQDPEGWSVRDGHAPMDYSYLAEMSVKDETGAIIHLFVENSRAGDLFLAIDDSNYEGAEEYLHVGGTAAYLNEFAAGVYDECPEEDESDEDDDSFEYDENALREELPFKVKELFLTAADAGRSDFIKYYLILDHKNDEMVQDLLETIDDTRNYGHRVGSHINKNGAEIYIEAFNGNEPGKREYLQIVENMDGTMTYSASHESYFLRIDMGDLYPVYFKEDRKPEYYIYAHSFEEIPKGYHHYKFIYNELLLTLHEETKKHGGFVMPEEDKIRDEQIQKYLQQSAMASMSEHYEESVRLLEQALPLLEEKGEQDSLIITYWKLAVTNSNNGNREAAHKWYDRIYDQKESFLKRLNSGEEILPDAIQSYAEAVAIKYTEARDQEDEELMMKYLLEIMDVLDGRCTYDQMWELYYTILNNYAYLIDSEEPERALEYYEKALEIAKTQGFSSNPKMQGDLMSVYNNVGWVMWNRLSDSDAVVYYSTGLALAEQTYATKSIPVPRSIHFIGHIGTALYQIYEALGKESSMNRIRKLLAKYNITPETWED